MKQHRLFTVCLVVGLWSNYAHGGDSIWDRRDQRAAYLFVDNRARHVGDLLTVVVREATGIDQKEKRALDKKSESGSVFNFKTNWQDGAGSHGASGDFNHNATSNRSFDGKSEFTSQRELVDRMTVTVIDVLPNGNLLIEGTRRRIVSGEDRTLRVTGMVRPSDITVGNLVESQYIANFQVAYEGKGAESKFTNQGWLSRAVNRVWPF
jgi:flagellar L-ring protein precursor FlgH